MKPRVPSSERPFRPHPVRWSRATSARYWDFLSRHDSSVGNYFSEQVGGSVLAYLRWRRLPLQGRVLDFGCGPGFFLEKMAAAGIRCEGVDFSASTVEEARRRVAGQPSCAGVTRVDKLPTPLAAGTYDLIVSLESVEHLLPEDLEPTFGELRRLLKPGGYLVLTTPNEEDLARNEAMCPECGCIFHRMQHVWSWSAASLSRTLAGLGWRTCTAEALLFRQDDARLPRLRDRLRRLRRRGGPHLVWIGQPEP